MEKQQGFLERFFKLSAHGTNAKTELIAGFTTFMTMAYILIVNPLTLEPAGMDFMKVFTATALSAVVATLVMGLYANLPFALAPGMGLNAFFTYTVVINMGKSFEFALTAVFLEGIVFLLMIFFNVREAIINALPDNIKKAISVGIGLFIAFIGLANANIVVHGDTILQLGNIKSGEVILALIGLMIASTLLARNIKGALFLGILLTTLVGIPMGITKLPTALIQMPTAPYFFNFAWSEIFSFDMLSVVFVFLFVDMFDTVGALVGVSTKAKMLTPDGKVPNAKRALFADAVGTTFGAILGTSTVTTYVESAAGVAEGGRTGLTSVVTAGLFAVALFLSPLFIMIPSAATAPALILVGLFMMSTITEIDFEDYTESIPAFLTLLMMPLAYSISEGISFGVLSFVLLKVLSGRFKEISLLTWLIAGLFVLKMLL